MDVWCNWCGTGSKVPQAAAGQELGCTACRRLFRVPRVDGFVELAEEEILGILGPPGDRMAGISEDDVVRIVAPNKTRLAKPAPGRAAPPAAPRRPRMWLSLVDGPRLTANAG